MIKPEELRIGNLVEEPKGHTHKICNLSVDSKRDRYGIPLTDEWLVKFGFERFGFVMKLGRLELNAASRDIKQDQLRGFFYYPKGAEAFLVEHVHQIQNLYYSLTGTELELKQ